MLLQQDYLGQRQYSDNVQEARRCMIDHSAGFRYTSGG